MTRSGWRCDDLVAEPSSAPCALHEADPAYSGLDEETLARARWRARRRLRRIPADAARGAGPRERPASELRHVAPAQIAPAPKR